MMGWINTLRESDKVKIVEGKKDVFALERIGIKNVKEIKGPLYSFIEEISSKHSEVIILTDLDNEGKKLHGKIKKELQKRKVKIDNHFREYLFKNTRLSHIEGINSYIKKELPFIDV